MSQSTMHDFKINAIDSRKLRSYICAEQRLDDIDCVICSSRVEGQEFFLPLCKGYLASTPPRVESALKKLS